MCLLVFRQDYVLCAHDWQLLVPWVLCNLNHEELVEEEELRCFFLYFFFLATLRLFLSFAFFLASLAFNFFFDEAFPAFSFSFCFPFFFPGIFCGLGG